MANYETVAYEQVEDKIRRLTLNRPEKLNAMSPKLLEELDDVMTVFEVLRRLRPERRVFVAERAPVYCQHRPHPVPEAD
jgi:enoyl-CoA hydratase/carnithine racemase